MEQSGFLKVVAIFFILLLEKAQMEESQKVVMSIKIQHVPFWYNFVGHEHFLPKWENHSFK